MHPPRVEEALAREGQGNEQQGAGHTGHDEAGVVGMWRGSWADGGDDATT